MKKCALFCVFICFGAFAEGFDLSAEAGGAYQVTGYGEVDTSTGRNFVTTLSVDPSYSQRINKEWLASLGSDLDLNYYIGQTSDFNAGANMSLAKQKGPEEKSVSIAGIYFSGPNTFLYGDLAEYYSFSFTAEYKKKRRMTSAFAYVLTSMQDLNSDRLDIKNALRLKFSSPFSTSAFWSFRTSLGWNRSNSSGSSYLEGVFTPALTYVFGGKNTIIGFLQFSYRFYDQGTDTASGAGLMAKSNAYIKIKGKGMESSWLHGSASKSVAPQIMFLRELSNNFELSVSYSYLNNSTASAPTYLSNRLYLGISWNLQKM